MPEALAGAVVAVPSLLHALKPRAKARLAIPIHAVLFIFDSLGSAHRAGCIRAPMLNQIFEPKYSFLDKNQKSVLLF